MISSVSWVSWTDGADTFIVAIEALANSRSNLNALRFSPNCQVRLATKLQKLQTLENHIEMAVGFGDLATRSFNAMFTK
jgi:hypothetical protein